jgi:hypothetical protein
VRHIITITTTTTITITTGITIVLVPIACVEIAAADEGGRPLSAMRRIIITSVPMPIDCELLLDLIINIINIINIFITITSVPVIANRVLC